MKRIYTTSIFLCFSLLAMTQPSNDECTTLIDLGEAPICPIIDTFTNVNATASIISLNPNLNIPSCFNGGEPDADVWFSFTIPADGSITDFQIELSAVNGTNGPILQPQMAIYRGDCGLDNLQEIQCATALPGESELEVILQGLFPGFIYYIRVEDWSASASPNWGDFVLCINEPDSEFIMGNDDNTSLCSGILFDSGGPDNDYSNNENNTFTICPTDAFACINFDVVFANIEDGFDNLTFHAGASTSDPVFLNFTGQSGPISFGMDSDCVTIAFSSDISVTAPGFELSWDCSSSPCDNPFITCANPDEIVTLPYNETGLSTCGTLNAQTFGPCPGINVLGGEDYIFTYNSPGDECISVTLANSNLSTAVSVYNDCPDQASQCVGLAINLDGGDATINSMYLENPGEYYIIVDNPNFCTDFDLSVEIIDCPDIFPATELCDDAISINGCGDENIPQIIQVAQTMTSEPECIQTGINNGGWGGIGAGHFNWFYFQAGNDGEFGFLANNGSPFEDSDIDINVWGPIPSQAELCDFMKTNQPARSTYAADNAGFEDVTGLTNTNPLDGSTVTDEIEDAGGDGFVTTLPVIQGQYYLVLINDWSGNIVNGGIEMDFGSTSIGVLDALSENFTITQSVTACQGVPFELEAAGGAFYDWFPSDGLSCTDCPNPMVTVDGPSTYQVAISTACSIDTLSVDISFLELDAGPDVELCQNEIAILGAQSNFINVDWTWQGSVGTLSCSDCPNPELDLNGVAAGSYEFIAIASTADCSDSDTILVNLLPVEAPVYEIIDDMTICVGEEIALGGASTVGVNYIWTASDGIFTSVESSPMVTPTQNITYYLEAFNAGCPNTILDSVVIEVTDPPVLPLFSDQVICAGEEVTILNIVTDDDITYSWSPTTDVADPTLANNIFTPSETMTYTLTASIGDCISDASFTIVVNPQPEITVSDAETICEGEETLLSAQSSVPGVFTWNPTGANGETFSTGALSNTTTFTVLFSDDNNCATIEESIVVTVADGFSAAIDVDPLGEIPAGDEITLTANTNSTSGNFTYQWSTGATDAVITPTVLNFPMETYSVTITDENGCTEEATITIEVSEPQIEIPNAFTPDGDNINDVFQLVTIGGELTEVDLKVYNRWGQKVHEGSGLNHGWDGMIDGKTAAVDVYAYVFRYIKPNGEEVLESGDVTLIR